MSANAKKNREQTPDKPNGSVHLVGPIREDGELYFSKEDLAAYELAQYKLANTLQGVRLKQNEARELKRQVEKQIGQLQVQITQLTALGERQKTVLKAVQDALTEKYGVDFSKVTYDDETGKITLPPEDPTPTVGLVDKEATTQEEPAQN